MLSFQTTNKTRSISAFHEVKDLNRRIEKMDAKLEDRKKSEVLKIHRIDLIKKLAFRVADPVRHSQPRPVLYSVMAALIA